jgi:hypothetical protein
MNLAVRNFVICCGSIARLRAQNHMHTQHEGNAQLIRPKSKWEGNNNLDLQKLGWEGEVLICLRQHTSDRLL